MDQITLYTITGCTKCQYVERLLQKKSMIYKNINLMKQPEKSSEVIALVGEVVTPILLFGDRVISGNDLKKFDQLLSQNL